MSANHHNELIGFVLEQAETVQGVRRARLYRALADIVGVPEESRELNEIADAIERADSLSRAFRFRFSQKLSTKLP